MSKERPILMSAPMVRAIFAGTKTQTRRLIKKPVDERFRYENDSWVLDDEKQLSGTLGAVLADLKKANIKCPYGRVGDRLWVRETFASSATGGSVYRADDSDENWKRRSFGDFSWTPSIHMPREATRILLEITGVRVERLQDISEADANAEGVLFNGDYDLWWDYQLEQWFCVDPIDSYKSLICKINGVDTWEKNPWVWVVEFKVLNM